MPPSVSTSAEALVWQQLWRAFPTQARIVDLGAKAWSLLWLMPLQDKKPLPPPASTSLDLLTLIIPIPGMMRVTDLSSWYTNLLFKTAAEEGVNNCKQGSFSFTNAFFFLFGSLPLPEWWNTLYWAHLEGVHAGCCSIRQFTCLRFTLRKKKRLCVLWLWS